MGKQQKPGEESALNSNLAGKHIFLVVHPFTLVGQHFSQVVTGGVFSSVKVFHSKIPQHTKFK